MKQKKRSGLIRIAALLLVLLLAVNLVVPCLAADTDYPILSWDDTKTFDTGVLNYDYDKIPDYMLNDSMFLRALAFTGYDVQFLMDQKLLFHPDYVGGNLEKNQSLLREDPILSGIEYNDGGKWGGLTKPATTEKELAATVTGKVPDIPTHLENGMSCTSFIDYFFLAYLPNCEGIDVSAIQKMQTTAGNRIANGTNTYPDLWTEMCEGKNGLIAQGIVKHYEIELSASKVQTAEYNAIWKQIHPGTIIRFGNASSPYVHYAIYVGTYNNLHYIIHVGNDRGPEIIIAETIGSESSAKQSWPIEFYDPLLTENYGSIQVIKTDADTNSKLAGATFMAINTKTGIYHPVGGAEKVLTIVGGDTVSVKYVNALRAGEIIINKVDGSTDAALAGAKFLLEWLDNDVWTPVIYSETIIPGGCASVGLENGCLISDENGQVAFYGLHPDCQYRLTEIDAPDGYILQAGTIFEGTLSADTLSNTLTVYNHPNFVLPSTGVNNNFRLLEIFALCLLAAFVLAVGYALNTIWVTRGKTNRK